MFSLAGLEFHESYVQHLIIQALLFIFAQMVIKYTKNNHAINVMNHVLIVMSLEMILFIIVMNVIAINLIIILQIII